MLSVAGKAVKQSSHQLSARTKSRKFLWLMSKICALSPCTLRLRSRYAQGERGMVRVCTNSIHEPKCFIPLEREQEHRGHHGGRTILGPCQDSRAQSRTLCRGPFATSAAAHTEKELLQSRSFLLPGKEYVGVPLLAKTAKDAKETASAKFTPKRFIEIWSVQDRKSTRLNS